MACNLTTGRAIPCKDAVGGLTAVYFMDFGDMTGYTLDATTNKITAVAGTPTAYKFDLKNNASTFEQTPNVSRDNGTVFYTQTLNLTMTKLDALTNKALKLIAYGRPQVIVSDRNGNFFLMGAKWGAEVSGGSVVTGGAMGDLTGYTLTLTGEEYDMAYFFNAADETALAALGLTISATQIQP